jgi:hypothetical protein
MSGMWAGLPVRKNSHLVKLTFEVFDQSQNVHDLVQDGLCLKGFLFLSKWSLLRRGAAKLRSIPIIFSMSLGGARGLGGAVRYCVTFFVFLVGINTWRHPTPYGSALNGGIPFSMRVMWCCSPLLMAGGKDMSLPVFIPLTVVMLFMFVPTPFLQGFDLT